MPISVSAGSTWASMKAATRARICWISSGMVKSITVRPPPRRGLSSVCRYKPPSTRTMTPVTHSDARLASHSAVPTRSAGWPARPRGTASLARRSRSCGQALAMSVSTAPGRIAFTRTRGPKASASPTVSALRPALAQA